MSADGFSVAQAVTKLLHLAPSTAVLVIEDSNGRVLSEEVISTELIEMGDLLKVALFAITHSKYLPDVQRLQKSTACDKVPKSSKALLRRRYICCNIHPSAW